MVWMCPPKIRMLKPNPWSGGYLEVGPLGGKSVMTVKLLWMGFAPFKRGSRELPQPFHQGRRHSEKTAFHRPGSQSSPAMNLPALWSWTSQPPKLWEINFNLFKPPSLGNFYYSSPNRLNSLLPLNRWMTLGRFLNLFEPSFPQMKKSIIISASQG